MNKTQAATLRKLIADHAEARDAVHAERLFHEAPSEDSCEELRKTRLALDAYIEALTDGD